MDSRGRESLITIIQVLLKHCDLRTLELRQYVSKDAFVPLSIKKIAIESGYCEKTCVRALNVLREANYIQIAAQHITRLKDGSYRASIKVKSVCASLLSQLGISLKELSRFHKKIRKRAKKQHKEVIKEHSDSAITESDPEAVKSVIGSMLKNIFSNERSKNELKQREKRIEKQRLIAQEKYLELTGQT